MQSTNPLLEGVGNPLGTQLTDSGVNFAVFSAHATQIDLCLFDKNGDQLIASHTLPGRSGDIWHGFLPGAGSGLVYGYRAHGPHEHEQGQGNAGHHFAPTKLLLDPYAKKLTGNYQPSSTHLADDENRNRDNADHAYKAVVTRDNDFDWGDDCAPRTTMADSVMYEVHVKGFSQQHPDIDPTIRGTYLALASDSAIAHFKQLGVSALKLLPVHHSLDEAHLVKQGKRNYWGYNTLAFFVPNQRYAVNDPGREFKEMVRRLHQHRIEVILDVVYNHTAEGDQRGPTLSMRGLDNMSYYRLADDDKSVYVNDTGCGNTVNTNHPRVLQWMMDSLRYWVSEMRVDGFRFDLAATLGRSEHGFNSQAAFFQAIAQDPVLNRVKLIAEPWDLGPGGYQLGAFPYPWSEWNGKFRDSVRQYWLRTDAQRGDLAARLAGSSDLFAHNGRNADASVNFICAHDGFTLHDLVSYGQKRNAENGENNRDGTDENFGWNCGHEGETDATDVQALRLRLKRAMVATLVLSRGVPMLLGGDELGRSQQGNNNAFAQDNAISWFDWSDVDSDWLAFVSQLVSFRQRYAQLTDIRWLQDDKQSNSSKECSVRWLDEHGNDMTRDGWALPGQRPLAMILEGTPALLIALNPQSEDHTFSLSQGKWQVVLNTATDTPFTKSGDGHRTSACTAPSHSVVVMERVSEND